MPKNNKVNTSAASVATPLLNSMSRAELASTAKALGVAVGKSRANTIANLLKATAAGKAHVKMTCTISFKPEDGSASRVTYFGKTLRTYVSGPGKGDETWLVPSASVTGSPVGE